MSQLALNDPVLLARLKRAREERGLTQDRVAIHLGLARTSVVAIEQGQRLLQPAELVTLSEIYDRALNELLRPTQPPASLVAQFRTAFGEMPEEDELETAAQTLQELSEDYLELERLTDSPLPHRYPAPEKLGTSKPDQQAQWLAERERERLRLGDGPLPHLRDVLEQDVGMRIFSLPLPNRIGGLFAFNEELGACVAINARQRFERQRYSLAHEFGHFLTRRDRAEITVVLAAYVRVPASERFADLFAQHLLMPGSGVGRRFAALKAQADGRITPALFLQLADYFGVSAQSMTLRLEDLKLIPSGSWAKLETRKFKPDEGRTLLGLATQPSDEVRLPRRYTFLAYDAYRERAISEEQFARFLRADRLEARLLAEDFAAAMEPDDNLRRPRSRNDNGG